MGAQSKLVLAALAATLALVVSPPFAAAFTAHPGLGYDLDGSPAPVPANLNQLDLYTPDGATPGDARPVVVYVHGGGWMNGNKASKMANKVPLFTGAGYVFASVNYRLSPSPPDTSYPADRIRFPDHPDDVGEAVAWIERNVAGYGGDPTRILLIGHSAGAHLVSLVATDDDYVERWGVDPRHLIGVVSLDTDAYDVAARVAAVRPAARPMFYSAFATPAENAADGTWMAASPITHAGGGDPEFLLVTQSGSPARVAGSSEMAAALGQDSGDSVLAVPYDHEGINDAVGSADDPAGETEEIMGFFGRMVAASRPSAVRFKAKPPRKVRTKSKRARVKFAFAAVTAAASYECRLDDKAWKRCTSPARYELKKGKHTFRVRAIASNGDAGPTAKAELRVKRKR